MTPAEEVGRAVLRLADQVTHWTPSRWTASAVSRTGSRADAAHALAQRLADLEATASGHPAYRVPRLDNDLALPDQWRVLVRDLVAADPEPALLVEAARAVTRATSEIF